jgi:hypothetical protein
VLVVQDALEQGGFAAAQKAGQDGYGNHGGRLFLGVGRKRAARLGVVRIRFGNGSGASRRGGSAIY